MNKFEYPMWKQSKHSGVVVKFENLNCGKVVYSNASNFEIGYFSSHWEAHTNLGWIDVTHIYKNKAEIPPLELCGTPKSAMDVQVGGNHYKKMKIQPMEYSMANNLDAMQHTIIKYVSCFRDKNNIEDLKKARHTLDMLIEWEQNNVEA